MASKRRKIRISDLSAIKKEMRQGRSTKDQGLNGGRGEQETVAKGKEGELGQGLVDEIQDEGVGKEEIVLGGPPLHMGL